MSIASHASPRRKNDPDATRARILDAAFNLFQEFGFTRTTMAEIAHAAAVTSGAMHHHFPSKKAIGLAVIAGPVTTAVEQTWLAPVRRAAQPLRTIFEIIGGLGAELNARAAVRGCPVNNLTMELAASDPDFRAALRTLFDRWRETLSAAILREPAWSAGSSAGAAAAAALIVSAYSGAMAIAKVEQSGAALCNCADELQRLLSPRGSPS